MIPDCDFVRVCTTGVGTPEGGTWWWWPTTRKQAQAFVDRDRQLHPSRSYEMVPYPSCVVCGGVSNSADECRCYKHRGRTPCSVEGCTKSRKFDGWVGDGHTGVWICGTHWRQVCPPRSALRRTYLRFFRTARKLGLPRGVRWPQPLEDRYWRFMSGLARRYNRRVRADEFIDVDEIHKLFGWTDG